MSYAYRWYRFTSPAAFAVAWAGASLPLSDDGAPVMAGGAMDEQGQVSIPGSTPDDPPTVLDGWHVSVAWPGDAPSALAAHEVPWQDGMRAFAGSLDPVPAIPVPEWVYNFQARAALMQMPGPGGGSLFQAIDAAMVQAGGVEWQAWEYATIFERGSPMIAGLAAAFGLSSADLDALFRTAATISA